MQMEIILWLLSWIYMNFPLRHLNKARIPVELMIFATPSFCDQVAGGRVTRLPFSIEIRAAPQWKKLAGRSRHLVSFLNRDLRVGGFRVRSRHNWATKGMPCVFWPHIWHPTRAKREKHTSLSGFRLHSSSTPLPFFYEMRRGYYPCRCHEEMKILQGMYSKWGCPYSQKLLALI